MNIQRLRQIQEQILREPEHFAMEDYTIDCGTTCCIGGWAAKLAGAPVKSVYEFFFDGKPIGPNEYYRKFLDLTEAQARELFNTTQWELDDDEFYFKSRAEQAQIASDYIDYFIAKHNPELAELEKIEESQEEIIIDQVDRLMAKIYLKASV